MQIVSFSFLIFFVVTVGVYYLLPTRIRHIWLFAASFFFYFSQGAAHTVFLLFSILSTWIGALLTEKAGERAGRKRCVLAVILVCNLLILLYFKYIGFFTGERLRSPILPIGISFYLFQSVGYLIDVYRGKVSAERDPIRYALFVSFFPIVLSGPIERGAHLLPQLQTAFFETVRFDADRIRDGFVRMLWGYFCKTVLADRIAIAVDSIFAAPGSHGGAVLFLTSILYTFQIYLDFAGYSSIAVGAAKTLGIEVVENFDAPYLAKSVGDFWRRWHISLSTWFRDYLYIPLGGNRKGQTRKLLNLMIVFLVSGLWHGAGWTFLIWGFLHGLYQVLGILLAPVRKRIGMGIFGEDAENRASVRILQTVWTFLLVNLAWIFFRLGTLSEVFTVFGSFAHPRIGELFDGAFLAAGVNQAEWQLILCGLVLVFVTDLLHLRGVRIAEWISKQMLFIRWPVYLAGVVLVIVCGVWGPGYDAASFIYYRF
ncbi:MAG: MBOAT family protein [Lachnospiraceae bacterium]|nr:MBOAT family protein [Lachnospiraceae bacterium]